MCSYRCLRSTPAPSAPGRGKPAQGNYSVNAIKRENTVTISVSCSCADLLAGDQQGEAVKQAVDGVSRLMDGEDDGAAAVRHPTETEARIYRSVIIMCCGERITSC